MKSLAFLFALLGLSAHANATNYLVYHTNINNAERCFVDDKMDSAYSYYDKAFAMEGFIFAKDAFVAAQVSYKHGDVVRTGKYLVTGAQWGLTAACVESLPLFSGFVHASTYPTVKEEMAKGNQRFAATLDTLLIKDWRRRYDHEQKAKNSDFEDYRRTVADNVTYIRSLLKHGRYPGDRFIGLGTSCSELYNSAPLISLFHYDCAGTEMKDELWEAVKRGEMHPRDFATLLEFDELRHKTIDKKKYTNSSCLNEPFFPIRFNLNWFSYQDVEILEAVKVNRAKYLIEDIDTEKKKKQIEKDEGYKLYFSYR